jgi:purine nucleosidase/pyrimidine-specific ribonucleoside hydrolase
MDEPWGALVSHITGHPMDHMSKIRGVSGIYLHDPLAVGVAIDPMMVVTSPLHVAVETGKGITRGMTLADTCSISKQLKQPANLHVALEVESERFRTFFKERLCRRSW